MTIKQDILKSDGTNTILQTSKHYATGTVKVWFNLEGVVTKVTELQELGEGFIMLNISPPEGTDIFIDYTIEGTIPSDKRSEYDIKKRITDLEEAVKTLHKTNMMLRDAVNNRINVATFQAWTRLIEKKTGITLIDNDLGYISQELYESKL